MDTPSLSRQGGNVDFTGIADEYDRWYETPFGRAYDTVEKKAVERMLPDDSGGRRLLEVGCGTGHWSAFFSERGFLVNGVDISSEMISRAARKQIPNASFKVADAHALPCEDGRFDMAAAITTLEFVRDAEGVVAEMARCTRSGGVLLAGVLNALSGLNIRRKRAGAGPYATARFFSPAQLEALLAPFGNVEIAVAAFVPRRAWALPFAALTDLAGRVFGSRRGAFLVGKAAL